MPKVGYMAHRHTMLHTPILEEGQVSGLGTVHPSHFKLIQHKVSSSSSCAFSSYLTLYSEPIGDGAMDDGAGSG